MAMRRIRLIAFCLSTVLAAGCFVEVWSSSPGLLGSEELAASLELLFAAKVEGVTATVDCPSGLTGEPGHRLACRGETSDGFTLEIDVLERGRGDFRWLVVESRPIR